jgi:hypothetical protein
MPMLSIPAVFTERLVRAQLEALDETRRYLDSFVSFFAIIIAHFHSGTISAMVA